jgi:hypothetical protein
MESVREVWQTDHCFGSGTAAGRSAARRQGSARLPTAHGCGCTSRTGQRFQSGAPAAKAARASANTTEETGHRPSAPKAAGALRPGDERHPAVKTEGGPGPSLLGPADAPRKPMSHPRRATDTGGKG